MGRALIVVDVQNDFTTGSMGVPGGVEVANRIADHIDSIRKSHAHFYDTIVASRDSHNDPGGHWSHEPDFKDSWPVHCAAGSWGAEFQEPLDESYFDEVFLKGWNTAAYSAFEGYSEADAFYGLNNYLRDEKITHLTVCGIATDYCVKQTVLDALLRDYDVTVATNLCAAVTPETGAAALEEMRDNGALIV